MTQRNALALMFFFSFPVAWAEAQVDDPTTARTSHAQHHDMVAMNSDEFARLDTNKDGQLSRIELPKAHALAAHFDMLDADNNGTLSADDFANGSEM